MDRPYLTRESRHLAARQNHLCFYCLLPFGAVVEWRGELVILRDEVEHFIPFTIEQRHRMENLVAACHVCNSLKATAVFDSVAEARKAIERRWVAHHIQLVFIPASPITEAPAVWAREFARWQSDRTQPDAPLRSLPVTAEYGVRSDLAAARAPSPPARPRRVLSESAATHCRHGHLFDEANTYIKPNGYRACRTCDRERRREYYANGYRRKARRP